MPRKSLRVALDNLKEAIQQFSLQRAIGKSDRRSISRGKKLVKDIEKNFSDQEAAEALEISRQKYTSLKGQIKKGKVSSAVLNDLLEETREQLPEMSGRPQDKRGIYQSDHEIDGEDEFEIDYLDMSQKYIKENLPWAQNITPGGHTYQGALNWYGGVTGGKEYFAIVRKRGKQGKNIYYIYDIRTPAEKARRGQVLGKMRADKVIKKGKIR